VKWEFNPETQRHGDRMDRIMMNAESRMKNEEGNAKQDLNNKAAK